MLSVPIAYVVCCNCLCCLLQLPPCCRTPRFMPVCTVPLSWWLMNRTAAKCTWRRPHSCYINQI
jgi:hypothetical protein